MDVHTDDRQGIDRRIPMRLMAAGGGRRCDGGQVKAAAAPYGSQALFPGRMPKVATVIYPKMRFRKP